MRFHIPKQWTYLVIVGLVLLAVAGAADSIESAMRDNYTAECDVYGDRFQPQPRAPDEEAPGNETQEQENEQYTPPTSAEREQCREARLSVTVMSVITRATLAPGIAIIALTAVFLVSAAISAGRR